MTTRAPTGVPEPIEHETTSRVESALAEMTRRPGHETLVGELAATLEKRQRSRVSFWTGLLLAPTLAALVASGSWWLWARDSIKASATQGDVRKALEEQREATDGDLERARQERQALREAQIKTTEIDRQQTKLLDELEDDVRDLERRRRR